LVLEDIECISTVTNTGASAALHADPLLISESLLQRSHQADLIATSICTLWLTSRPSQPFIVFAVNHRNAKDSSSPIFIGFHRIFKKESKPGAKIPTKYELL
jgi:hypothetical protein